MSDLDRRAAKHAALADPVRLGIVETLVLGDASPTELQAVVDVASNLLAHHLRVLEDHGMITRRRSEGDRRRSYVQLAPGALDGVMVEPSAPWAENGYRRIVFVCTANSARSRLAAALWTRSSRLPTASAGTHPAARVDAGAVAVARRRRIPLPTTRPASVDDVLRGDDLVVTVCDNAHEELDGRSGLHWSIPDPVAVGTEAAFDSVVQALGQRVSLLTHRVPTDDRGPHAR